MAFSLWTLADARDLVLRGEDCKDRPIFVDAMAEALFSAAAASVEDRMRATGKDLAEGIWAARRDEMIPKAEARPTSEYAELSP